MCDSDRARRTLGPVRAILLAAFAAALVFGCMPYELRDVLDGPQGKPLSITPTSTVVIAFNSISFAASGGVGPYVYAVIPGSGAGSITAGVFYAASAGTVVIRVTDKTGKSVDATVTIQPVATGLQISPVSITISVGASITFVPIGGSTPYGFAITTNNSGAIPMVGAVYKAGPTPGVDDTVTLTDGAAATATATIHVVPVSSVDYAVSGTTFPGPGTVSSALPGGWKFTLQNIGSSAGTSADWKVYLSANATLDGGDFVLASGTENGLGAPGSVVENVTGTFPGVAPGSYSLIVQVTSADDTTPGNNTSAAVPLTLDAKNINYVVSPVSSTGGTTAGAAMTGDFTIENTGTADGSATILWQVRASPDSVFDASDYVVAGGLIAGGLPKGPPATTIPVSGTWPSTPGTWYLFAFALVADDIDNADNLSTATMVTTTGVAPANVEYRVDVVSNLGGTVAGDPISGTFTYHNYGTNGGAQQVYWTAYLSSDATLQLGTDVVIDSGSAPALGPSPATNSQPFTGTWPSAVGSTWHLIVSISASDDVIPANNVTANAVAIPPTTAPNINYRVIVNHTGGTIAGGPFTGNMTVENIGTHDGKQAIPLRVFISLNNALLEIGTDELISSGSIPAPGVTAGGSSVTMPIAGTWPSSPVAQNYYLIVEAAAGDDIDSSNNAGASGVVGVAGAAPNYTITAVPVPTGTVAGQAVSGSFSVQNGGNLGGSSNVIYQVYASLGNSTYDAGDTLLATGSFTGLAMSASTSPDPTYLATWPQTPGIYRIILRLSAADDPSIPDAFSGSVTVSLPPPPDYTIDVPTVILPAAGAVNTLLTAAPGGPFSFCIRNTSGNTGGQQIDWKVYASNDGVFDGSDALLAVGSRPLLAGSSLSAPITFDGTWPSTGAYYHLIIVTDAPDDSNPSNDAFISGPIEVPTVRTEAEINDGIGPYPGTLALANDVGSVGLNGLLKVTGTTDGRNLYDTFKINVGAGAGTLEVKAVWSSGSDAIDLYAWDETGLTGSAVDTLNDIEEITWILPHTGIWYISVKQIINPPGSGFAYNLYIHPAP